MSWFLYCITRIIIWWHIFSMVGQSLPKASTCFISVILSICNKCFSAIQKSFKKSRQPAFYSKWTRVVLICDVRGKKEFQFPPHLSRSYLKTHFAYMVDIFVLVYTGLYICIVNVYNSAKLITNRGSFKRFHLNCSPEFEHKPVVMRCICVSSFSHRCLLVCRSVKETWTNFSWYVSWIIHLYTQLQ